MSDNRRVLSQEERMLLEQRGCSALSWDEVTVTADFRPEQLRNVRFEGRTSIGSHTRISDSTIANYIIGNDDEEENPFVALAKARAEQQAQKRREGLRKVR